MTAARPKLFVLLGTPGTGKGTQADLLSERFGLYHIDTGRELREEIASGSELGQTANRYMAHGQLVPIEVVFQIIERAMERVSDAGYAGFLFDGFPRNMEQFHGLNRILAQRQYTIDGVIFLESPDEVVIKRLNNRMICPHCDAKYNLLMNPPKIDRTCDRCGTQLITRTDDRPEVIEKRFIAYRNETKPLVDFYRSQGNLIVINGNQPIEKVFTDISQQLTPFFAASTTSSTPHEH